MIFLLYKTTTGCNNRNTNRKLLPSCYRKGFFVSVKYQLRKGLLVEQLGQVIERVKDNKAIVKLRHHNTCGNCGRCSKLFGDPEKHREDTVEVLNPIGAKEGEVVRLETNNSEMLLAAFLLYILPLLGLLAGLFWGRSLIISAALDWNPELGGIAAGGLLMVSVFLLLRKLDYRFSSGRRFKAVITGVVNESELLEEFS